MRKDCLICGQSYIYRTIDQKTCCSACQEIYQDIKYQEFLEYKLANCFYGCEVDSQTKIARCPVCGRLFEPAPKYKRKAKERTFPRRKITCSTECSRAFNKMTHHSYAEWVANKISDGKMAKKVRKKFREKKEMKKVSFMYGTNGWEKLNYCFPPKLQAELNKKTNRPKYDLIDDLDLEN